MASHHLHPKAEAELDANQARLVNLHKLGLITREQAARMQDELTARIVAQARVESHDDRMIRTRCVDCQREHTMRHDVPEYTCRCSPSVTRYSFQNRIDAT